MKRMVLPGLVLTTLVSLKPEQPASAHTACTASDCCSPHGQPGGFQQANDICAFTDCHYDGGVLYHRRYECVFPTDVEGVCLYDTGHSTGSAEHTPVVYEPDEVFWTGSCNKRPVCSNAVADSTRLWPPNHRMIPVAITGVTDPDGDELTLTINSIRVNEPANGRGDGDTASDWVIKPDGTAKLRAERSGDGSGRLYTLSFTADDGGYFGTCTGKVTVCVPHDAASSCD
jgi:hypothetical protein